LRWEFATGDRIISSPAVAADRTLYVGSDDGNFYALNTRSGQPRWVFSVGTVIHSSPVIARNGTIYFGAARTLFAVKGAAGPALSSWPMYRQNERHTGRVTWLPGF